MADLRADTRRIRDCSDSLWQVHSAFTNYPNPLEGHDQSVLGSTGLVNTFSDFADNWKIHRKSLAEKVEALGKILGSAADTYDQADSALASALREIDEKYAPEKGR